MERISALGLLPGEDRGAFEKLHRDLIAEFCPEGPLQEDTVTDIAWIMWRKKNLKSFVVAEATRKRYLAITSEMIPSTNPPMEDLPILGASLSWTPPDEAEVEAATEAAEARARQELGENYKFIEMGGLSDFYSTACGVGDPGTFECHGRQTL